MHVKNTAKKLKVRRHQHARVDSLWRIAGPVAGALVAGAVLVNNRAASAGTVNMPGTQGTAGTNGNSGDPPTNGTAGGNGSNETATTTTPTDTTNTATATGGAGGDGGTGGDATAGNTNGGNGASAGSGGNATATATTTLTSGAPTASATASGGQNSGTFGGAPGTPSGTGSYGSASFGGTGGNAAAAASATTGSSDDATATARANGGTGGNPGYYTAAGQQSGVDGNGGDATSATAYASTNGGDATATATAMGGTAGESDGIGAVAGTPGTAAGATAQAVSSGGGTAGALATEEAGGGGQAANGANAGNGGNQSISNAVSGSSPGGSLELTQSCAGGTGGAGFDVNYGSSNSGNGGNAVNNLNYSDTSAIYLEGDLIATGGNGGNISYISGSMGNGGNGGNATGTLSLSGANQLSESLYINAGHGGTGSVGGAGGVASGSGYGISTGSEPVYIDINLISGAGGSGNTQGGNGGNCTASNALSGSTANSMTLDQSAEGGSAGSSLADGGKVGTAGNAVSMLTANNPGGGSIQGIAYASGGSGGSAFSGDNAAGGNGGNATSYANISSTTSTVIATAESYGGFYGSGAGTGVNGQYGTASATAIATSPVSAYANVQAVGGSGSGTATANTSGSVIAALSAVTGVPALNHYTGQAVSEAEVNQSVYSAVTGYNAFSAANGMPFAADVTNATSSTTNVKAAFAQGTSFNMGLMTLSDQSFPAATTSTQSFTSQTDWTLTAAGLPSAGGNLMVGLFGATSSGTGTATFTITLNGVAVGGTPQSFASLSAASSYFTDQVLNLGAIDANQTGSTITLDFSLTMSSAAANAYLDPEIIFATPLPTEAKWTGIAGNANWMTAGNWVGNTAPTSPEALVFAGTAQTTNNNNFAAGTVFDGINFDSTAGAFTLNGNSIGLGGDIVNDSPSVQTINLPIALQKSVNLSAISSNIQIAGAISGGFGITTAGPDTVTLTGSNSFSGTVNANAGTLVFGASRALPTGSTISIGSVGDVSMAAGIGPTTIGSLTIVAGGTLDITNNHVFIDYGSSDPIATIVGYLRGGFNNGNWNGPGIISSTAQTPTNGLRYGVGWADGKDKIVAGISSGQIELKYTLLGDANLDGTVNGSDFSLLAANFGLGVTNWDQGNFLYGSSVNGSDFSALAANFGQGDSGADESVSAADIAALDAFAAANGLPMPVIGAVPEPASAGMVILSGLGMLARRRRA